MHALEFLFEIVARLPMFMYALELLWKRSPIDQNKEELAIMSYAQSIFLSHDATNQYVGLHVRQLHLRAQEPIEGHRVQQGAAAQN